MRLTITDLSLQTHLHRIADLTLGWYAGAHTTWAIRGYQGVRYGNSPGGCQGGRTAIKGKEVPLRYGEGQRPVLLPIDSLLPCLEPRASLASNPLTQGLAGARVQERGKHAACTPPPSASLDD